MTSLKQTRFNYLSNPQRIQETSDIIENSRHKLSLIHISEPTRPY